MKILLVDDKPHVRDTLKQVLEQQPFKYEAILEASCDQSAIQLIETQQPDIIVTDASLLLLFKGAMLDHLEDQFLPSKIIVTSSHEFVLHAFGKGGIDTLRKPIDMDELKSALLNTSFGSHQENVYGDFQEIQ